MTAGKRRRHDRALKVSVVRRLDAGESLARLSEELGIGMGQLSRWRKAVRLGGEAALRDAGRPHRKKGVARTDAGLGVPRDMDAARRQIAALQRKVGEQQLALDFFEQALRRIEASRQPNDGPGETASSPRSRR